MASDVTSQLIDCVSKVLPDDPGTATAVVRQLTRDFGGTQLYVPMERAAFREEIDREVYEAYNGDNGREICKRYDISFTTMYDCVRREKARRAGSRDKADQSMLPFEG